SETPFSIPALNELEITSVIVENTSCFGECDGAIFIEVAGGVAPLFYQWANGETSQNIDNLCAGWYGLTVVDGNGCTGESNFLVEEPSLIVAEVVEFVPPSCGQSNGFLQLVASGGTPPYIYSLDGIDSESGIFSGLPVGDYSFTVTDANGCFVMPSFTLEDTGINAFIIGDGALNCIDNTAELLAFPEGDFQYEWTGPNGFTATTRDIFIGDAGLYTVMITDLNDPSCTGIAEFFVEDAPAISLQTIVDYDECQIPLVSGTVAPAGSYGVQILLNGTDPFGSTGFTGEVFTLGSLPPGNFTIIVTDTETGCSMANFITVEATIPLEISSTIVEPITCDGQPGSITIEVTGGQPPYLYLWSDGSTSSNLEDITEPGTYVVSIVDANGCTISESFFIESENTLGQIEFDRVLPSCDGTTPGSITAFPTGGMEPFSYEWNTGANTQTIT
ncbi:MAG: SprB repeat-containing protein, partial [Bacteroidota bacterium]